MNEPEPIGQRILDFIACHALCCSEDIILWTPNAADQLDALIANHTADLQRKLDSATEAADQNAADAAALDILITQARQDLDQDLPCQAANRIDSFRDRNVNCPQEQAASHFEMLHGARKRVFDDTPTSETDSRNPNQRTEMSAKKPRNKAACSGSDAPSCSASDWKSIVSDLQNDLMTVTRERNQLREALIVCDGLRTHTLPPSVEAFATLSAAINSQNVERSGGIPSAPALCSESEKTKTNTPK